MINGVAVTNTATGKRIEGIDRSTISDKKTLADVVEEILDHSDAVHSAGALVTENVIMQKHEALRTAGYDSFMGCPIDLIRRLISEVE